MLQRLCRTLIARGRACAGAGLVFMLGGRALPAPAAPPAIPAPRLVFISATMNFGAGQPLPPDARRPRPELWGLLRIEGAKVRKSDFRVTVQPGGEDGAGTSRVLLSLESFKATDPADPTLFRWSTRWPKDVPPEGWTAIVHYRRNRRQVSATGPVKVHFLPAARKPAENEPRPN